MKLTFHNKLRPRTSPLPSRCETPSNVQYDGMPLLPEASQASSWVKIRDFIGVPSQRDFRLTTSSLPELKKKEILVEGICWSIENYMRAFDITLGSTMIGDQVGCVLASRHADFQPLDLVVCPSGWRTHTVLNPEVVPVRPIQSIGEFPASVCLGTLGLPGLTAYFGFLDICQPKSGSIVVVNAAAGSVGSVVGQLAKIKGCTVIAYAASKKRCAWIRELGFDYVYCKSVTVSAALAKQAPYGVDVFFDCVGAEFTQGVVQHMKTDGTIVMCGYNSCYGRRVDMERRHDPYRMVVSHGGKVRTCTVYDYHHRFPDAMAEMIEWMNQGKLRFRETIMSGFDQLPTALTALYDESTVGNLVVKSAKVDSLKTSTDNL